MIDLSQMRPIVDCDVLVYRGGFAADSQMKKEWMESVPDGCPFDEAELANDVANLDYEWVAISNVRKQLDDIYARFAGEPSLYLTGHGNFRESLATIKPYKGNRDAAHKPKYYRQIKDWLTAQGAVTVDGQEADDAIAQEHWAAKGGTVLCTIDKDILYGLPGWHYDFRKEEVGYTRVDAANLFHFRQLLEGDSADNIPGINRVGTKTVDKWWEELEWDMDKIRKKVQECYKKQYGEDWQAAYQECSDLLWLRRVEGKGCPFLY